MSLNRPWTRPLADLLASLDTIPAGLTQAEAERRLLIHGQNDGKNRRRPLWRETLDRFSNPLILILLFASLLSAWTGQTSSFFIVVGIILLSVALDVVQQRRAEHSVEALRRAVGLEALVLRDGAERSLPIEQLVPGDVVRLAAGDVVPADGRLLAARDLFVNQAALTGEPYPVEKHPAGPSDGAEISAATNYAFMGTSVISGTATLVICTTGAATELGGLARTLTARRPRDAFEQGIRQFGMLMLRFTIFLVLFVLAANVLFQRPWLESLMFALALAVGLTPELLPMVVTVTLANGAQRMAGRKVIVKRLAAIHDLGAMDVLCTDKTGTLTESRIRLVRYVDCYGADSDRVLELAYVNSVFETGIRSPLDQAILDYRTLDVSGTHKIDEVPFDFERRRVSVLVDREGGRLLVVKGAPEDVIRLSSACADGHGNRVELDDRLRRELHARFEALGDEGYRVLGVASRAMPRDHTSAVVGDETELTFAGFAIFLDPPKAEAAAAIEALGRAGVGVKILTGDNERITRHICKEIGLPVTGVVTGDELARMSQDALRARLPSVNLFCRVSPQQKERVLTALKTTGSVAGFLGDGINDASALHAADVGISVDTAADVAKEAADLVLLDRDLGVVLDGVLEGRRTVENVNKYILMGSSSNLGNMFSMAGASLFLPFLPMLPAQVLLNNLLYDVSEVGVPFDEVDAEALDRPVPWKVGEIERFMLLLGPVSSAFDFLTFWVLMQWLGASPAMFQAGWFIESLATQSLVIFVIRTRGLPWRSRPHPLLASLSVGVVAVGLLVVLTPLGGLVGFVPLPAGFFVFLVAATASYLFLVELAKRFYYRRMRRVG
ncbi:MAG: magnesium-translocating P-type ATPase [Hyphomicrobiaceae bacterium]|nr:magnesium-translocating P-type ATPase [Hyphomicrobiaceae bacterium]